jgi:enamine deaminase RidA (YjgF/YER057c/UK114 family)
MSYAAKLQEMGYTLQTIELNAGRLMHAKRSGNLIYTSGQVSRWGDQQIKGKVGRDVSVEDGYEAAKLCTLNCLQAVHSLAGSLDNVVQVVKVFGMVNVAPDFDNTPAVIHGCSDLLIGVFGEAGLHARSAIGLTVPDNWACEIEVIFEVK